MRPRALRIPGIRDHSGSAASLFYSSRISRWLEDKHLVLGGDETDWKKQYKLRHNWSRGSCDVTEIQVAERPSLPPMLVQLHEDIVITADKAHGLRAWMMRGPQQLLGTLRLSAEEDVEVAPTSLAIESSRIGPHILKIAVGFSDGHFGMYTFLRDEHVLTCQYTHAASVNGPVSAIASACPYLITMTSTQLLSLYRFTLNSVNETVSSPRLLSSLKSHTAWPPLTLSIRATSSNIITSIAYALPTYLSGWSVGLQELRLTTSGTIIQSRLTSAANQGFTPLFPSSSSLTPRTGTHSPRTGIMEKRPLPSLTKPTSLSYSHPYLLASHPDNTLTLYLVQSTETELVIGAGSRLWGHTSSVSGAHVGDRGKAVSVSAHGDEIRVWELEGGVRSSSSRKRVAIGEESVQVRPEHKALADRTLIYPGVKLALGEALGTDMDELSVTKGWVGFDEEKVVVLRESGMGTQALVVYDFS